MSDPAVLEFIDLYGGYGSLEVLHGVSLAVGKGEIVALVGPNGAGKSTLAKMAAGELSPTRGCVHVGGFHVNTWPAEKRALAGICTLPEGRGIFPNLTVAENLRLLTFGGETTASIERSTYERFPALAERSNQLAGTLSGGEQQMLAMARCVSSQPALLILDELSSGLAPQVVAALYGVVDDLARRGTSVLLIEQFTDTALGLCDRVVVVARGRAVIEADPADVTPEQLSAAYLGLAGTGGRP